MPNTVTVKCHGQATAQAAFDVLAGRGVRWTEGRAWHTLEFEWVGTHYAALVWLRGMFPGRRIFCKTAKSDR